MIGTTMTGVTEVSFDETIPSSFVLDRQMRDDLREPFPPEQIGQVNKGFGTVDFIGHAAITDRLNRAAPGWTYRVEPVVITGKDGLPHVMAVFGTMTVGGVTRQEVGDVEHMTRYGDELKKAISDFICRGAMRFGVGLDLWSKELLSSPTSSGETPASAATQSAQAGEKSAPTRGRRTGAEGGTESIAQSSVPPSSSEGTTTAADEQGHRGTTADPSTSPGGDSAQDAGADLPGDSPKKRGKKKYPADPKQCLHMVGVDVDGNCEDCGTPLAEVAR